ERNASRAELQRALRADRLVTLSPRVRKLADEVTAGKTAPLEQARAIYDYLLATMKYDKTVPGWGNGDTERGCDIRKGNCTDFHSLFISLARAKGIPARFVIGFPLTAADGHVAGYHCWAEFYVRGRGWIPVDASDASKSSDPAVRDYLFGHLDPNRVQFTVGRDLNLKPRTVEPLNYFLYPYAESGGTKVGSGAVALDFQSGGGVRLSCWARFSVAPRHVEADRGHEHGSFDDVLRRVFHAQQRHAVVEAGHDQRAEERAGDFAAPAHQRGSADHAR